KPVPIVYTFVNGYLIVASSNESAAEAIRLHRSGESLAKSSKFLSSFPAGYSSEASALLYEDAVAMTALQLRRFAPEMTEKLPNLKAESIPVTFAAYGDENAIRSVSASGGADVTSAMVVAAIAIPNLLRARIAANEASAVSMLR